MIRITKNLSLVSIVLFCILEFPLYGQNLSILTNYLGENTKKSIDNAQDKISEAGQLILEANEYYNEALALQTNYELDEKTLQKKIKSAEDKAVSTQIKADKLYAAAYKSLYQLCEKNLSEHTIIPGDPAEEYIKNASGLMDDASLKRKEVSKTVSVYEKASMLNDASGMESAAIENMIIAIQLVNGLTPVESLAEDISEEEANQTALAISEDYSSDSTTKYVDEQRSENLAIDYGSINKYNNYTSDPTIPDPVTITAAGVSGVDDVSFESALDKLHQYNYGDRMLVDESTAAKQIELELAQQEITQEVPEYIEPTTKDESISQPIEEITTTQVIIPESEKINETITPYTTATPTILPIDEVRFMVQIAASRVPLTKSQVSVIYSGDLTIDVMQEDDWIKYRITGYRLFSDAYKVVEESGVRGAWVISTYSGQTISLPEAREMIRAVESDIKNYGRDALRNDIDFYVQLAASRVRLGNETISRICGGTSRCREVIEEGWFKYQVYAGTNYQKALSLQKDISRKSFIVAYKRGARMKLYKAIR